MSDFGAGACDFHSDFASDFRTESNDYASDFRDFPGDFSGGFSGEPLTAKQPPEPPADTAGAGHSATPQGHKQGVQRTQSGGNVGTAARVKVPYRGVKMANKAYDRKAPGIHREQMKTPHSLRHAGRWSFLEFGQIEK